jgi:hypothetical protein
VPSPPVSLSWLYRHNTGKGETLMKHAGVVVIAISLIGACAWLWMAQRNEHAALTRLQRSVEDLNATEQNGRSQSAATAQLERAVLTSAIQASASHGHDHEPDAAPPAVVTAPPKTLADYRDQLQIAFALDSQRGAWTVQRQRAAVEALTAALPEGSSLRSLDCRASLCRLETEHQNASQFKSFFRSAFLTFGHVSIDGPVQAIRTVDGAPQDQSGEWVTYVGIDGHALPIME